MNSETDFVAQNEKFKELVDSVLKTLIKSDVTTVEEALELPCEDGTVNDLIVSKTATIGEKLSLRRFAKVTKGDNETFGSYIHMGGKIAVLIVTENTSEEVARDVAMHAAAMRPKYVKTTDVPAEEVAREEEVLKEQAVNEGKPAEIAEKWLRVELINSIKRFVLKNNHLLKMETSMLKLMLRTMVAKLNQCTALK